MTDAEKITELEAYIDMLELDFEAKVDRAIKSRLSHAVDEEINRRNTQATFERSKKSAKQLRALLQEVNEKLQDINRDLKAMNN